MKVNIILCNSLIAFFLLIGILIPKMSNVFLVSNVGFKTYIGGIQTPEAVTASKNLDSNQFKRCRIFIVNNVKNRTLACFELQLITTPQNQIIDMKVDCLRNLMDSCNFIDVETMSFVPHVLMITFRVVPHKTKDTCEVCDCTTVFTGFVEREGLRYSETDVDEVWPIRFGGVFKNQSKGIYETITTKISSKIKSFKDLEKAARPKYESL